MATKKAKEPELVVACANCRFFHEESGACRRNPPQLVVSLEDGEPYSMFPPILPEEWCGSWAAKLNS
jgi:hypothetical protein